MKNNILEYFYVCVTVRRRNLAAQGNNFRVLEGLANQIPRYIGNAIYSILAML